LLQRRIGADFSPFAKAFSGSKTGLKFFGPFHVQKAHSSVRTVDAWRLAHSLDDLRNKRLKAIMQPDYSRQFKLWRPFSDIKTTNQFQVISDLSWPETLAL